MDNLELIDAYFQNELSSDEKAAFEQKCVDEKTFAEEVAFYVSARKLLKDELLKTKQDAWQNEELAIEEAEPVSIERNKPRFTWVKYAVAACLVLAVATYFFEKPDSPQQMAKNYVTETYTTLPQKMGVEDKIGTAKTAYNNKDYGTALTILNSILLENPENEEALKFAGIVYLVTNDYDKAIGAFSQLAKRKDLFSNPGMFLQAVALLERNSGNDKEQARQLLEQVVEQNAEGSKEAREWLKKF